MIRYFSLFVVYTPYTIYQCRLHIFDIWGVCSSQVDRWFPGLVQAALQRQLEMCAFIITGCISEDG